MARKMGTPCPSKEEDTNPSAFVNLTSLPKTRAEEDINTQSKCDLKAQSSPHQVDYMDNNLTNRRKCNGAHLRSDDEVSLLKSLVEKTENTTTLHDGADDIQNDDHDDYGITNSLLLSKDFINLTDSGVDPQGMGRWSYITINGRNKKKLTIISAYRAGKTRIQESGPSTAFTQQWDFMEERGDTTIDVRKQMTKDLSTFIKTLATKRQEIILYIDANEEFDTGGKGIAKLVPDCNLINPITQAHGYINEPETYIREKDRIYFIFCTLNITAFITACGITSYDVVAPSDYQGEFLDIKLQQFLANSFQEVTYHTSRKIQTRDSVGVITYKEHLREFTTTHHIFDRINNLKHKLSKRQLKIDDMIEINDLNDLITKGMIASKNKILNRQNQYPWSPTLEQAILEVS